MQPTRSAPAHVRFYLDGALHTVAGAAPATTLLEYLRDALGRTGTKEGCAQGDCGACTVVLCEPQGDRLRYQAVNACIQLLAAADGKEVLTVESLSAPGQRLHPVQQALLDAHASQCGFCMPGVVMSLFARYRSGAPRDRDDVRRCLAGNLCRCSGYRPFLDAGLAATTLGEALPPEQRDRLNCLPQHLDEDAACVAGETAVLQRLRALRRGASALFEGCRPGGPLQSLHVPRDLDALLDLTAQHPLALLVAGGTEVGVWLNKQQRELGEAIYIGEVAALQGVELRRDAIDIGAATPLTDVQPALLQEFPELAEMLWRFGSPPIRNVATLGGNLATASPIADAAPALMALDAQLVLLSRDGERRVAVAQFFTGYRRSVLRAGEIISRVVVPRPRQTGHLRVYKVSRRHDQDIAVVNAALRIGVEAGVIRAARVAFGGVADVPLRVMACEAALLGKPLRPQPPPAALAALAAALEPIDDLRGTAAYRQLLAANLLRRFFLECAGGGVERVRGDAGAAA